MKHYTTYHKIFLAFLLCSSYTNETFSQVQGKDILKDNYIIGKSAEIFTIRIQDDTVEFRIFDAVGNINEGGIVEKEKMLILENEWQAFDHASPVSIISGDFDGDKYSDVIAAWEATDSNIVLFIPEIDPESMQITSDHKIHLRETGMPGMYFTNGSLPTLISLKKGQLDNDKQDEVILAYMADQPETDGGPVMIAVYDLDSGLPVLKDSLTTLLLKPELFNAANGISRGSLFDVCTGDFNQDGVDEIVLAAVTEYPVNDDFGWRLDAYMYQFENGELKFITQTEEPIYIENANSSDYIRRLAIVAGNFDNDFLPDIAVSYQVVETGAGDSDIYLRALKATVDSFGIMGDQERIDGSNGNNGWPICMRSADADRDGFDEVQLAVRNTLSSYSFDENMNRISKPSHVFASGLNTEKNDAYTSTFAATDMDLADCDTLKIEIAVIDTRGLLIYQKINSKSFFEVLEEVEFKVEGVTAGDFDGDALRLGSPRRQTINEIVQPLMILSTPPVHFDIFGEEVFDLQDCYPIYEASENCESSSVFYVKTEEKEIESSVEISSTWTKTDLPILDSPIPGHFTPDYLEIADRLINKEFNKIYGGGEVEKKRSSQTFTFTSRAETTEDDNIQCLITEFELLEFPVYSGDSIMRHVLIIEPSQNLSKTRTQWIPFRSSAARNFHPNHEVGNILSYPKTTNLPPDARPFGLGGYEGGLVTWTVSPSTSGNWNMKFSSSTIDERESTSTHTISNDIKGTVTGGLSAGFAYGELHLDFEYLDNKNYEEVSSVKTTIKASSEINVSIGKINTGLIGTKTYDVTPFMYWDASGALILDYAVSPDYSGGVPSFWEERYGEFPDLTFNLPWRYSGSRGLGGSDDDLQSKQTYDIVLTHLNIEAGDTTDIVARIQNYSNVDVFSDVTVKFYLGDPDEDGELIINRDGLSQAVLEQVNAREPVMARLNNWIVPGSIAEESMIFAVIDEGNLIEEVHENNNKAWSLIKQGFGAPSSIDNLRRDHSSITKNTIRVYPNPVQGSTTINYSLREASQTEILIYNLQGTLVKTLLNDYKPAGEYSVEFDASSVDNGMYLYYFTAGDHTESGKITVVK